MPRPAARPGTPRRRQRTNGRYSPSRADRRLAPPTRGVRPHVIRSTGCSACLLPLAPALVAALPLAAAAQAPALQEGTHYVRLKNPLPVDSGDKIEVLEFFSYGCPHCADLEPVLVGWQKTLPADVAVPARAGGLRPRVLGQPRQDRTTRSRRWASRPRLTPEVFAAIHRGQANLSSPKTFFDWAAGKGLDRKKVEDMYNSFAIAGKMNKANQVAKAYRSSRCRWSSSTASS